MLKAVRKQERCDLDQSKVGLFRVMLKKKFQNCHWISFYNTINNKHLTYKGSDLITEKGKQKSRSSIEQ